MNDTRAESGGANNPEGKNQHSEVKCDIITLDQPKPDKPQSPGEHNASPTRAGINVPSRQPLQELVELSQFRGPKRASNLLLFRPEDSDPALNFRVRAVR